MEAPTGLVRNNDGIADDDRAEFDDGNIIGIDMDAGTGVITIDDEVESTGVIVEEVATTVPEAAAASCCCCCCCN